MKTVVAIALILLLLLLPIAVLVRRRKSLPGPDNNWKNQSFAARERSGSWVENETWVGHDDADPSSSFPGLR